MTTFHDLLFHLDDLLYQAVALHLLFAYLLFFVILFAESAFFPLAPFLPGDGLLFGIGVLAAGGHISLIPAIPVLIGGGVLGNWVAWQLGRLFGTPFFDRYSWLNRDHFIQAQNFYQRYGSRAFLLSRFIPLIRSLVPFVAGVVRLEPTAFRKYNLFSVSIWVCSITLIAYFIGHIPLVKQYFSLIIFGTGALGTLSMVIIVARQLLLPRIKNKSTDR